MIRRFLPLLAAIAVSAAAAPAQQPAAPAVSGDPALIARTAELLAILATRALLLLE